MGLISFLVLVGLVLWASSTRSALRRLEWRVIELERELGARTLAPVIAEPAEPAEAEAEPAAPQALPLAAALEPAVAAPAPEPEPEASPEPSPPEPAPPVAEPLGEELPAEPPEEAGPSRFTLDFEELFGRRLPIWAGGITLAIAGVFIVRYAIEAGFFERVFTPGVQSVCGMLFGLALIAGAEWAYARREKVADPRVSQALSGAGISTLYAALLVASEIYHLIGPLAAFVGVAVVTALALWLSLRHGAPSALLGLAGGLSAPALTAGVTANVPLLSVYLALTIGALVGVARRQRWPWLAMIALVCGAGWSLWLALASAAYDAMATLSLGGYILLLAIALPLFAFEDAALRALRAVAAIIGAAQVALLVSLGGFAPLHWGLFGLIALAGQWLAWREPAFGVVPTFGAALSFLLLLIWPDPAADWLIAAGLALALIHAVPLLLRLWNDPPRLQRAVELAGIALAAPLLALRHGEGEWQAVRDVTALAAAGGALLALGAAALGWTVATRRADARFALLAVAGAGLAALAACLALADWHAPLSIGVAAVALLLLARPAGDHRIEPAAAAFAVVAFFALVATVTPPYHEFSALLRGSEAPPTMPGIARWLGLALMGALFAWRGALRAVRDGGGALAALMGYGVAAQLAPDTVLPLLPPLALFALAGWSRAAGLRDRASAMALLALVMAGWALLPLMQWQYHAIMALTGQPMPGTFADWPDLQPLAVLRRLLFPAGCALAALVVLRDRLTGRRLALAGVLVAIPLLVSLHLFYRQGFAALFGVDFAATGIAQRLLWVAILAGAGRALALRGGASALAARGAAGLTIAAIAHLAWFSLLLHNPLWDAQAVGQVPVANLLAPLFAALPVMLWLLAGQMPRRAAALGRAGQLAIMAMIALWGWASLRQAFHGTLLVTPGLGPGEDILRSILGIALALGYLLWGIRTRRRAWRIASLVLMLVAVGKVFLFDASGLEGLLRIASFVALGFSLIGIGWLYSRQLRREQA